MASFKKIAIFAQLLVLSFLALWAFLNAPHLLSNLETFSWRNGITLPLEFFKSEQATTPRNEVGKLPALGWNTWNAYRCDIDAQKVLDAAIQFTELGLKAAGYEYINIDDCWSQMSRDKLGRLVPDHDRFPNGISGVVEKVHELGLKVGIYSDAGIKTCAGYPASLGYEEVDAQTFADWGIDYLKYDNCNVPPEWEDVGIPPDGDWFKSNSAIRFKRMSDALAKQARPIQYSLCIWGRANVWSWGPKVGHSWRIFDDSQPTWYYLTSILQTNLKIIDHVDFYSHNDMDMMEIGNGNLSIPEQRSHFAVWAFLKSPILLGTDLGRLSEEQLSIITNSELLAFHQDPVIGTPAKPFDNAAGETMSPPEYYSGLSSKGVHVFILNTNGVGANKTIDFASVPDLHGKEFLVHDMWTAKDIGNFSDSITVFVPSHDTAAFLISPV